MDPRMIVVVIGGEKHIVEAPEMGMGPLKVAHDGKVIDTQYWSRFAFDEPDCQECIESVLRRV